MTTKNNNKAVIQILSVASYKHNKNRNRLMIGAVSLTIVVIYCIFSIMLGRINAEYTMEVREHGSTASSTLERPTKKQIKQLEKLTYLTNTGVMTHFADGRIDQKNVFASVFVEEEMFKTFYAPAYTDLVGSFPKAKDELMLSIRGLAEMGIQYPKVGMALSVEVYRDRDVTSFETFRLSGYYTDYVPPIFGPPIGFFSAAYFEALTGPEIDPTVILLKQTNRLSGKQVEKKLYRDVSTRDDSQRFDGGDSVNYNVVRQSIGGYDIALLASGILFLCVFLLNYNVMAISLGKDVQYYGLLKTIGATDKQIRNIMYRQIWLISLLGGLIGSLLSVGVVQGILPRVLAKYYMRNYGVSSELLTFNPSLLLIACGIAIVIAFLSILLPVGKVSRLAPLEALKYSPIISNGKVRKLKTGSKLYQMAWRNATRDVRRFIMTVLSLFIGLSISLVSFLVTDGLDYTNNFATFPDFSIENSYNPSWDEGYKDDILPVTQEDLDFFCTLLGLAKIEVVSGDFVFLDGKESVWQLALKADFRLQEQQTKEDDKEAAKALLNDYYAPILVADEAYLKEFEAYVLKHQLSIDLESFKNGTGIVARSFSDFSPKMKRAAKAVIGEQVSLANYQKEGLGQLIFSGYFEPITDDFPILHVSFGLGAPNLMISEKGLANLGLKSRAFKTEIYVEPEMEPESKKIIKRWVSQKENALKPSQRERMLPWVNINSDFLADAQDEIRTIKITMYAVSLLMVILGLMNFFNTVVMNIISRKRELAVLESVGMVRKQLRRLLVMEGLYYSLIVGGLLSTVGVFSLKLVYKILKSRIGYATYAFPVLPFVVIIAVLIGFCVVIPLLSYKKVTEESMVERLHGHDE